MDPRPLGQLLVGSDAVSQSDLDQALELQARSGGRLGSLLMRRGAISEDSLLDRLAQQLELPLLGRDLELPSVEAMRQLIDDSAAELDWFLDQQLLVWPDAGGTICFSSVDPLAPAQREALEAIFPDRPLQPVLSPSRLVDQLLADIGADAAPDWAGDSISQLRELAEEAPIVELVNNTLAQAMEAGASDVHIEPEANQFRVRFRIDGVLHTRLNLPRDKFNAVTSRIKLISNIDIAERRLPQDGRVSTRVSGREVDIRVSTLPGTHGESVVMRLLPKERKDLSLQKLGLLEDHLAELHGWLRQAHGIMLVTGPTGSGKSTTLYAGLQAINDGVQKIITVEDPVEFQVANVTQVQAHADIGLSFAAALRSILRQDPDVIMIGEIRDLETAEIAVQAALTGHLVLSTVHTNEAVGAFTRLIDMGIEPFLVADPVIAVQAQRLVRRLCEHCAEPFTPPERLLAPALLEAVPETRGRAPAFRRATGCAACSNTGYRGRLGIYEMVGMTDEMRDLIVRRASVHDMRALARRAGHRSLREDGLLKAYLGWTSVDEVLRVTGDSAAPVE